LRSALSYFRGAPLVDTLRFLRLVRLVRNSDDNRFLEAPGFMAYARRNGDVPLDRVFGTYLTSQLIRMMTVRMNAAEPDEVFIANFGTNLGMLLDHFDQLSAGFDPVFERFSGLVNVKLRTRVGQIITEGSRVTGVGTETASGKTVERPADIVVIALPSWDAATLVEPLSASLAGDLREIRYFPLAVAIVEYVTPVFTEQVRALTFPKSSILSNAGAYGTNDRHIVRYTFSGAGARDFLKQHHDSGALMRGGEQELELHTSLAGNTRKNFVTAQWKHGLCAYAADHHDRLLRIATESARWPNLLLAGDYVRGASIEACFRGAQAVTAPLSHAPAQY
jgi:protoporphyrinogen/coproporphyrinogen III oxidase